MKINKTDTRESRMKSVDRSKDQLEFATNWRRVFMEIYQKFKWLSSYQQINEIAMQRILVKFSREYFELEDNIIEKNLTNYVSQKPFVYKKDIQVIVPDLVKFFADNFLNGNKKKANNLLNGKSAQFRQSDALSMMYFFGATTVAIIFGMFFLIYDPIKEHTEKEHMREELEIRTLLPIFRLIFLLIYFVLASGIAVHIFESYGINYLYVLDIDPKNKMSHYTIYRVSMLLLFIFAFTLACTMMAIRFETDNVEYSLFAVLILFVLYCSQPCIRFGYRSVRTALAKALFNVFTTPFGEIKFRHYFLAEIISSMAWSFTDLVYTVFLIINRFQEKDDIAQDSKKKYKALGLAVDIVSFLPFWFRLSQNIVKYYKGRQTVTLFNVGKYMSKEAVVITYFLFHNKLYGRKGFWWYFGTKTFSEVYSFIWDLYIDWGCLRSTEKGKYGIR